MRHNVFVSYRHDDSDQYYRNQFEKIFSDYYNIFVSKSVQIGDINDDLPPQRIRQIIRDKYLRESTVTVVLIGEDTWKRKHIDWEIGASIRQTEYNSRSGLIGIILPSYPRSDTSKYTNRTIPPRLHDNIECGFAKIYNWNDNPNIVQQWIHEAFLRRSKINPDNSFPFFINNRSGLGWQK